MEKLTQETRLRRRKREKKKTSFPFDLECVGLLEAKAKERKQKWNNKKTIFYLMWNGIEYIQKNISPSFFSAQSTFTYTIVYVIFKAFYLVVYNILPYLCCELIYIFLKFKCFSLFFLPSFPSLHTCSACLLAGGLYGKSSQKFGVFVAAGFLLQRPFLSLSSPSPPKKKECSDEKYKFHIYFWFSNWNT